MRHFVILLCVLVVGMGIVVNNVFKQLGEAKTQVEGAKMAEAEVREKLVAVSNELERTKGSVDELTKIAAVARDLQGQVGELQKALKTAEQEKAELRRKLDLATAPPPVVVDQGPVKLTANPTSEDAKKLFAAGQYQDTITAVARVLAGSGAFDRNEMLMLRAESMLQTKQLVNAIEVLEGMRKMASLSGDVNGAANAGGLAFLLRRSPGGIYTPRTTGDKTPLNVINRELRRKAFAALFEDALALCERTGREAGAGRNLLPLVEASRVFQSVQFVERVNTGGVAKTGPLGQELAGAAKGVMDQSISAFEGQIEAMRLDAHKLVLVTTGNTVFGHSDEISAGGSVVENKRWVKTGLSPRAVAALHNMLSDCMEFERTSQEMALTFGAQGFARTSTRAGAVAERSKLMLAKNGLLPPD